MDTLFVCHGRIYFVARTMRNRSGKERNGNASTIDNDVDVASSCGLPVIAFPSRESRHYIARVS